MDIILKRKGRPDEDQKVSVAGSPSEPGAYYNMFEAAWAYAEYTGGGPIRIYSDTGEPLGIVARTLVETEEEMEALGA